MKKICIFVFLIAFLITCVSIKVEATDITIRGKSAVLMEEKTKTVLFENNSDVRLAPASMTKVMSLLIIYDNIKSGKLRYDDVLETSEYAASMGGSQVFLEAGEKQTVDTLLKCICIASGNDATVTIAEKIAGSEEAFVAKMNEKAKSLNLVNTLFQDSTGLTSKNHYTTAYDMAIMSRELLFNYPEVINYTSIKQDYIRKDTDNPFWLVNTNKLIGVNGVDGLKTGWTNDALYCLTATKSHNGMRLISVVMGYESPTIRNNDAYTLLNYGFANYELVNVLKMGTVILEKYDITLNPSKLKIVSKSDIYIVKDANSELGTVTFEAEFTKNRNKIIKGEDLGNAYVYIDGKQIGETKVIALNVKKNSFGKVLKEIIKHIFI